MSAEEGAASAEVAIPAQQAQDAAGTAGRSMRQRKAGPPLLEGGGPDPPGKGKPVRPSGSKKGGASAGGAATSKKKTNAAGGSSKVKAAPVEAAPVNVGASAVQDPPMLSMPGYADSIDNFYETNDGEMLAEEDDNLYCICLERDDGRPLIQCEGCQNWCASMRSRYTRPSRLIAF